MLDKPGPRRIYAISSIQFDYYNIIERVAQTTDRLNACIRCIDVCYYFCVIIDVLEFKSLLQEWKLCSSVVIRLER